MAHNERGHEIPDSKPGALPVGFDRPPTMAEMVRNLVRGAMSQAAAQQGQETWEESDDFDVDDDPELKSRYELDDETASIPDFVAASQPKPSTAPVAPSGEPPAAPQAPVTPSGPVKPA